MGCPASHRSRGPSNGRETRTHYSGGYHVGRSRGRSRRPTGLRSSRPQRVPRKPDARVDMPPLGIYAGRAGKSGIAGIREARRRTGDGGAPLARIVPRQAEVVDVPLWKRHGEEGAQSRHKSWLTWERSSRYPPHTARRSYWFRFIGLGLACRNCETTPSKKSPKPRPVVLPIVKDPPE